MIVRVLRPMTVARSGSPTSEEPPEKKDEVALDAADANAIEVSVIWILFFDTFCHIMIEVS